MTITTSLWTRVRGLTYDINELPSLDNYDDDEKGNEKLIVFDDFINLKKKEMTKINEFLTSGRKFGFSVFCMAQNYTSIPKIISRNTHYFIVFRLNDNTFINNIIRNHNIDNLNKMVLTRAAVAKKKENGAPENNV